MPSDTDHGVLRDILHHIELAERFTRDHTFETFKSDELHLYAVTRCLEVISEASRRLSDELKARHVGIPWKQMAGAGNVYRHDSKMLPRSVSGMLFNVPCRRYAGWSSRNSQARIDVRSEPCSLAERSQCDGVSIRV
jgi:uncharacterized protein with HEPN domain